jgi:glycosyltransferase involved in cell wall biosynthesis
MSAATVASRAARKVAHITLAHRPFDVRVFHKECRTLAAAGYDVHLAVPEAPLGRRDGIAFHRIERGGSERGLHGWIARLGNTLQVARALNADLYHLHDPELIPVGLALKGSGARVVYDAHEDAPIEAWSINRGRPVRRVILPTTWWTLLGASGLVFDGFVAATSRIARSLPTARTIEVRNYPRLEMWEAKPHPASRCNDLIFAGLLSETRGAMEMLDAVAALDPRHGIRLKLFGTIASEALAVRMRNHPAWPSTDYAGHRPWLDVLDAYRRSLAGFLLYQPTPEQRWCMPVKLFEFLLAALPVIASDIPFWRELLDGNPSVHFVDATDPNCIAASIAWILSHPEESARRAHEGARLARERFDWEPEGQRLVALYDRLLN